MMYVIIFFLIIFVIYILSVVITCIDRYRYFKGHKIKEYFNSDYYDTDSIYSECGDSAILLTFIPGVNLIFSLCRLIFMIYLLVKLIFIYISKNTKFNVLYKRFINLKIK